MFGKNPACSLLRKIVKISALILLVGSLSDATAHTHIDLYGVGIRAGVATFEEPLGNVFNSGLEVIIGKIEPDLKLICCADFWSNRWEINYQDLYTTEKIYEKWMEVNLTTLVIYRFYRHFALKPYVGTGFGLKIYHSKSDHYYGSYHSSYTVDDSKPIFQSLLGLEIPISSRISGCAELKYTANGTDYTTIYAGLNYTIHK